MYQSLVRFSSALVAAGVLIGASLPAAAASDGVDDPPPELSKQEVKQLVALITAPKAAPGISFGSPVAFGANWGDLFIGVGGTEALPVTDDDVDGAMSIGGGIGNSDTRAGLEVSVNIISLQDDFGDDGNVNAKFHTTIGPATAIAIGAENLAPWGNAKQKHKSYYAVLSTILQLNRNDPLNSMPLSITIGAGDERFAHLNTDSSADDIGVFGAIAFAPHRRLSVIADWTGRELNAGISTVPLGRLPVTLSLGMADVTDENGNGEQFTGSLGVALSFGD